MKLETYCRNKTVFNIELRAWKMHWCIVIWGLCLLLNSGVDARPQGEYQASAYEVFQVLNKT